jgi:prepilin-type N-terminal cleavage/methylation domain-containing protein
MKEKVNRPLILQRKPRLTLIEVMIVLAIVAILAAVTGLNVQGLLQRQRFLTEVELLSGKLRLAQDMMLLLGANMHVKFQEKDKKIVVSLDTDATLPPYWEKVVSRSPMTLTEIHSVSFVDRNNPYKEGGEIDLRFLSNGTVMSAGELLLSTHENPYDANAVTRYICLMGTPYPIIAKVKSGTAAACEVTENKALDDSIINSTMLEVQAK